MRACWGLLILATLSTQTGCRLFERWQKDRPSADPAARDKARDPDWLRDRNRKDVPKGDSPYELPDDRPKREPGSLLDPPNVPASNVKAPAASTWAGPTSKNFDLRNAAQRLISGYVETKDGQVVEGAFVSLENADPTKNTPGAQVGVQTDRNGLFLIQGLKPGDTYILTATVRNYVGKQYVTVPNQQVRIQLRDDYAVAPLTNAPAAAADLPGGSPTPSIPPPGSDVKPPALFDTKGGGETLPFPAGNDGNFSPVAPAPPTRPDLIAQPQDKTGRLPPVSIPGPSPTPAPAPPLLPLPGSSTSKSMDRKFEFKLLDADGKDRTFPTGREGDLVLLDFAATNCVHCTKAIPTLTKLHDTYRDQALQVVTVLCDGGGTRDRLRAAEQYRRSHRFPYELLVEARAGAVQDAFQIKAYPTLVLIDGTGRQLWTGHPKQADQLERTIREFIESRSGR